MTDSTDKIELSGIFQPGYFPANGHWDEMVASDGSIRAHWKKIFDSLKTMTPNEMKSRWEMGSRLIRENGVTYNIDINQQNINRSWQLDPLPIAIDAREWQQLGEGLGQRAKLFNMMLADFYGQQNLLVRNIIPPSLVLGNPGYLRPLKTEAAPNCYLHFYAADIARRPDGQWCVLSDYCEAPTGVGYALENRSVISRLFGDTIKDQHIRSLTPFFQLLQESLSRLSPRISEAPRIVLLTPGPYNESYFEHAFLSRSLGCTLVEGEDLTMRDKRVWLRTLDGLQPVDVILRRTNGHFCDPLELRSDSVLGIAGLCQAVRSGTVVAANALGSGLLEGNAMMPFLPSVSSFFLGEELKLSSAITWWCGDKEICNHVLNNVDDFVIKPAFARPSRGNPSFSGGQPQPDRNSLIEAILRRPHEYLAQEQVKSSSAPVWNGASVDAKPVILRVFLVENGGEYLLMPGALGRVAADSGGSKDVWILTDGKEQVTSNVRTIAAPVRLQRGSHDLPSRVAENLFWFGRHLERNECVTRLLRAGISRAGAESHPGAVEELVIILNLLNKLFKVRGAAENASTRIFTILQQAFDPRETDGPRYSIEHLYRLASMSRDRLSADTWRAVNGLKQAAGSVLQEGSLVLEESLAGLNNLILASESLNGLIMENMTRGLSWRFVDMGRRIERAIHIVDMMAGLVAQTDAADFQILNVALEVSDSSMTYRSRYLSQPQFGPVLDLLMIDETNPRSLAFQFVAIDKHLNQLAMNRRLVIAGPDQRLMIWLTGALRTVEIDNLCKENIEERHHNISHFLEMLRSRLWELTEIITHQFFTHAQTHNISPLIPVGNW